MGASSIPQPACLLLFAQRSRKPIGEKERAQGFDRLGSQGRQKATERGARGQAVSSKERHIGSGKGMQALVEGFEGALATDGVAEEHGDKVDHLIVPETATGKADTLGKSLKDSKLL